MMAEASLAKEASYEQLRARKDTEAAQKQYHRQRDRLSELVEHSKVLGVNVPEPYETTFVPPYCFPEQDHEYLSQPAARRQRVLRRVLEEQERAYDSEKRWQNHQCPLQGPALIMPPGLRKCCLAADPHAAAR